MISMQVSYRTLLPYDSTPQHRKEAIDDGAWSKLDRRLVSTPLRICEFLAVEVEQWLNRKPCSSSTNAENVAARNGGDGIRKRHLLRQCLPRRRPTLPWRWQVMMTIQSIKLKSLWPVCILIHDKAFCRSAQPCVAIKRLFEGRDNTNVVTGVILASITLISKYNYLE